MPFFDELAAAISQVMQGVFATVRFAFDFAGGQKTLAVLLVVFILCAIGVWMTWNNDSRYTAFFGGNITTTSGDVWESMSPNEAIEHVQVSYLEDSVLYRNTNVDPYHTAADCSNWMPIGGADDIVITRELFQSQSAVDKFWMDCGYAWNSTALNGTGLTEKLSDLSAIAPSLCRDDQLMTARDARSEANRRMTGDWIGVTLTNTFLIPYETSALRTEKITNCNILYNDVNHERIYCEEASVVFKTDLACTTATMPILTTHGMVVTASGVKGLFIGMDNIFISLASGVDNFPVLKSVVPWLTGGTANVTSIYVTARDLFKIMIWLAAILFVLTCVWAVYASHRTF